MYFQDVSCLESHLNNDWAIFLRNLKKREECHYQLLQYNKNIIAKQRDEDDELFVKDQILQHQKQCQRISDMDQTMNAEEKELVDKYQDCFASDDQINKLMGRVGARVLETCQSFLDKSKAYDKQLIEKYREMKSQLVKLIHQKDQLNVQQIQKIVIAYSKNKLLNEVKKLKKLICGLQNGQYERLQQIYIPKPARPSLIVEKKNKSQQKPKNTSVSKEASSPIRDEIKKQERIRKQKQKLVTKMTTQLYSTMDLNKGQLFQDMSGNAKQRQKQLYLDIMSRNKYNHHQIIAFQAKQDSFHEKVKIFKQMMKRQSERIAEVLIQKPIVKPKQENQKNNFMRRGSKQFLIAESCDDVTMAEKKSSFNRYRISSPKGKKDTKDMLMNFSANQSTNDNFKHFKFDTSSNEIYPRTNRNRLPQIPNFQTNYRASSLEHRFDGTRHRQKEDSGLKELKIEIENAEEAIKNEKSRYDQRQLRPRMALKNVEVGVEGVLKKSDPIVHGMRERKKVEPNPMEYTFYVKKSGYRFYQPKNNNVMS